jgi:hypothetical protein
VIAVALTASRSFSLRRFVPDNSSAASRHASGADADYHRRKIRSDPLYARVVRDSRKKWRDAHPGYQKRYRQTHPEAAERNRQGQRQRDAQRRVRHLVRNNVALDLKRSPAQLWLVGPLAHDLVKNNVAVSRFGSHAPGRFRNESASGVAWPTGRSMPGSPAGLG